jgi:uncharacterized membrane protein
MSSWWSVIGGGLVLLLSSGVDALAQDEGNLASRVESLFTLKCTECHGSQVPRPKGKFGYVTDLPRLRENPALLVQGKPLDSELYLLLTEGDEEFRMPPPIAREGPLTEEDKDLVRRWILAGAPAKDAVADPPAKSDIVPGEAPSVAKGVPPDVEPAEERPVSEEPASRAPTEVSAPPERWLVVTSKLHPLLVHFPIALVLCALLAELLSLGRESAGLRAACRYCLRLAAVAGPLAAFAGWWAGEFEGYHGFDRVILGIPLTTLDLHRWAGVASGSLPLVAAILERKPRRGLFRLVLLLNAAVIVFAAYHGGGLVYGEDHLPFF